MNHSLEMALSYFCLLFMVIFLEHGVGLNDCEELRCGGHGPPIRFPFRLKDTQPDHCGYPGFDLSCTERNDPLLELPTSVKLYIKNIDYKSQVIYAYDPDGCIARHVLNLNLSTSPFQFEEEHKSDYTWFKCSSTERGFLYDYRIPCLGVPGHDIYAIDSDDDVGQSSLSSCTKMYNISSIPRDLLFDDILHLHWSKPTCGFCEAKGQGCRLKNSSTEHDPECFVRPKPIKDASRKLLTIGIILGSFLLVIVVIALYRIYRSHKLEGENQAKIKKFLEDYRALKPTRYSYADLKRITNQFKDKLGQGAYGTVFKGKLSNEILVAVKILNSSMGNGEEFVNEVGTMGRIHHVNVVRLVGYSADGFRKALVYEFLPNESLEKFIFSSDGGKNHFLGWEKLHGIALGIAKGIEYLHQGCDQQILHFDIKPHNILLDDKFNPKISDFGLAKLCSKDQSAVSMTAARGTMGYIAPEVFSRNFGNVSYKSDVYSFGMLLLEMVGGRKNVDVNVENTSQVYFPEWIYNRLDRGEELIIQTEEEGDAKIARKLTIAGLWCIQWYPIDRPSMKIVVQMLEGEGENLTMPPNPFASTGATRMNASMPGRRLHQELTVISETE